MGRNPSPPRFQSTRPVPWLQYGIFSSFLIAAVVLRHTLLDDSILGAPNSILRTGVSSSHGSQPARQTLGEYDAETGFYQSLTLTAASPIYTRESKYQKIEVHESHHFGKILMLDGVTQLTERDADSYNEMMAHVPLFQHPNPVRVLVIGGGDGYVVNEALKHPSVEHVDHVELDNAVIETCKKHFSWGHVWKDPRVHLHIQDGATFVEKAQDGFYDVIIQDSSDPWTWDANGQPKVLPSSVLYAADHYRNIYRILSEKGVLNFQAETFHLPSDLEGAAKWRQQALAIGFERARYGTIAIATYPTGQIGFMMCEKKAADPLNTSERYRAMVKAGSETSYYQPRLQESAFDLPLWVEKTIYPTI